MRKRHVFSRDVLADPIYGSKVVTKLVNRVMLDGKRGKAQTIVYKAFNLEKVRIHPKTEELIEAMQRDDLYYVANNMKNLLENVTLRKHNVLIKIKEDMNIEPPYISTYSYNLCPPAHKPLLLGDSLLPENLS